MADNPALQRYQAALKALRENAARERAAGIDYETPEYLELNRAVVEAEKDVPWWRRLIG